MSPFRTSVCGALLAACAICGSANTKAASPAVTWEWTQTGGNFDVVWSDTARHVLHGGGVARITGGGDNAEVVYADTPMLMQAPAEATLTGGGDNATVTYAAPADHGVFAGAPAVPGQPG